MRLVELGPDGLPWSGRRCDGGLQRNVVHLGSTNTHGPPVSWTGGAAATAAAAAATAAVAAARGSGGGSGGDYGSGGGGPTAARGRRRGRRGSDSSVAGETGPGGGTDAASTRAPAAPPGQRHRLGWATAAGPTPGATDGGNPCACARPSPRAARPRRAAATCCTPSQLCCRTGGIIARPLSHAHIAPVSTFTCVTTDSGMCPPTIITCGGGGPVPPPT